MQCRDELRPKRQVDGTGKTDLVGFWGWTRCYDDNDSIGIYRPRALDEDRL